MVRRYLALTLPASLGMVLLFAATLLGQPGGNLPIALDDLQTQFEAAIATPSDENVMQAAETVAAWIDAMGTESRPQLSALSHDQLAWLLKSLTLNKTKTDGGFVVTWSGHLRPPRTGTYNFSTTAIHISSAFRDEVFRQRMTVKIGGQTSLEAKPDDWMHEGQPMELTAGTSVPIEVMYRYECPGDKFYPGKAPAAILFWKGPGIARSVVPTSVLVTPDGGSRGLQARYQRINNQTPEFIATVVEPNIERVWLRKLNFVCPHRDAQQQVFDELWQQMTAPAYLESCEGNPADPAQPGHDHFLVKENNLATYLTCQQRADFLEILVSRPLLLERISTEQAFEVYTGFRYGAYDEAIEFLGTWMQSHADLEPQFSEWFSSANRGPFRDLVIRVYWQDRRGYEALLADYLELPDGGCCLPAAYTLSYCHLSDKRIRPWVELLDDRIADQSLTGDTRVNWLLARAQAEEMRLGKRSRYYASPEAPLAGLEWINEARLVAESAEAQSRALKEEITREAAMNRQDRVADLLEAAAAEDAAAWQAEAAEVAASIHQRHELQSLAARQGYITTLERRHEHASERGNSASAARYRQLLEKAGAEVPSSDRQ